MVPRPCLSDSLRARRRLRGIWIFQRFIPTPFFAAGLVLPNPSMSMHAQDAFLPFEKHVLDNGLQVVLHEDHSDPVVAVYVYYHVGSSREEIGRSGFAHLFEHMLFQGSEHVGDNQHFKLIQEGGGTLNGTTNQDRTNYFETLPADKLELALWLESDRMGFLLPAMTQEKLDNQREVVKNERRQRYENQPYGLVHETVLQNLYPAGHPYSWTTIGSMEDLEQATLDDIANFFRRWYGPNNATLAIGGDFDPKRALMLVEKYFGSIPRGPEVDRPAPLPTRLEASRRLLLEDRVQLPQLTLVWPTVEAWHPDEAALDLLADVLSANRSSVLDRALLIEEELASYVTIAHSAQERAGTLTINLRPNPGVSLDQLEQRVDELLESFLAEELAPERLARMQNRREGAILRGLETVSARTSRLAFDNCFSGDPGRIAQELAGYRAVQPDHVQRVARRYVVGQARIGLSVVPHGKKELAATGSGPELERDVERAPLDRTQVPADGTPEPFRAPDVWHAKLANGISITGSPYDKIPLSRVSLSLPAGRLRETREELGLASLMAEMLEEGTERLDGNELVEALDELGADLSVAAGDDELVIRMSALNEHLPRAAALLVELVLTPRFAEEDFERLKRQRLLALETRADRIGAIAADAFARLVFGETTKGSPAPGTAATIGALELADVQGFWKRHARAEGARLAFVGAASADDVVAHFAPLAGGLESGAASALETQPGSHGEMPSGVAVFLVDKPGAQQSEIRIGHPGVAQTDPNFFALQTMNYPLGGNFSSRINMNLREDKGYTYGARSAFTGARTPGVFVVASGVETDVTAPAVAEVLKELEAIGAGLSEEEVEYARQAVSRSLSRTYESAQARLSFLEQIAKYGFADDFPETRLRWLGDMKKADLDQLVRSYIHPKKLFVLIVGDAERVAEPLAELGLGPVTLMDRTGRRL